MSTTRSVAGTVLAEAESRVSSPRRGSRTSASAWFVSTVENMCGATAAPAPVSALKTWTCRCWEADESRFEARHHTAPAAAPVTVPSAAPATTSPGLCAPT